VSGDKIQKTTLQEERDEILADFRNFTNWKDSLLSSTPTKRDFG
jgi:hypothetical protein